MTPEPGDPVSPQAIEQAAARARALHHAAPDAPLDVHVAQAARDTVGTCAPGAREPGSQAAILAEVGRRIWLRLDEAHRQADDETVDQASEQSFPASDPPGWISRGRPDEGEAGAFSAGPGQGADP